MSGTRVKATRPRNRKQQIIAAASDLFRASGYHNVGMSDIAAAVGISGPALYRHFSGKQELLYATVIDAIDRAAAAFGHENDSLPEMLGTVAAGVLERRSTGVLWERMLGYLPLDQRHELRARYIAALDPLRAVIAEARPDLSADVVELLLRATLAAYAAMGHDAGKVDQSRARQLMADVGLSICRSQGPRPEVSGDRARPPQSRGRLLPVSRREAVLAAATRLFAERGYEAVGMEDIAAGAAGLAGPSLYHHFASKSAILVAALTRCLDAMLFDLAAALDLSEDAGQALDAALHSFVRINLEHGAAMSTLLNEVVNVPEEERQKVRRMQLDYLAEWTALLTALRPEIPAAEARMLVQAAHSVVNSLRSTSDIWIRPAYRDEIISLGRTVLGVPSSVD